MKSVLGHAATHDRSWEADGVGIIEGRGEGRSEGDNDVVSVIRKV